MWPTIMNKFFKFSTIAFLLLFLIGLILFISIGHSVYSGKGASLTFKNQSGLTISIAIISVSGQSCSVKKLENHGEINCYFGNLGDSGYTVYVELSNGSKFNAESLGYVTGGIDFSDIITINEEGEISLEQYNST